MVAKREWKGEDWKFEISRCKLLFLGRINNKVLMCSTGNYIQYPMINHNEKIFKNVHMCVTESLCCTAEIGTALSQLYFSKKKLKNEIKLKVDFKSWYLEKKKERLEVGSKGKRLRKSMKLLTFILRTYGWGCGILGSALEKHSLN